MGPRPVHIPDLRAPRRCRAATMTAWRAGVEYRTGGPLPIGTSSRAPLCPRGSATKPSTARYPNSKFNGLQVWGSYAGALLIQSNFVPKGYVAVVATSGPNADLNPVAVREHTTRLTKGYGIFRATGKVTRCRTASLRAALASAPGTGARLSSAKSPQAPPMPRRNDCDLTMTAPEPWRDVPPPPSRHCANPATR